jgi:hypothetical protein
LAGGESFDPVEAARREVEWWRAHGELQRDRADGDDTELVEPLANLYSYVYSVPLESVLPAAKDRAEAMVHSDRWVADGCGPRSPLIAEERQAPISSYEELLAAVRT